MKLPIAGIIDERFLMHRTRSTSIGGMAAILLTAVFFFYNLFTTHLMRWDLFAIVATAAIVKIAVLIYYRLND
jgi:glucan phosphoethanolaminetransferase (alkaline phosphatase superfamily)